MKTQTPKNRRALSPVISALILSAAVLAVGGAMWGFSQGAMTITAEDYAEAMINMTETFSERFIIEHVYYEYDTVPVLHVFVYNYGSVDIRVKLDVENDGETITYPPEPKNWRHITAGGFEELTPDYTALEDDELVIRVYTWRENSVSYKYLVP